MKQVLFIFNPTAGKSQLKNHLFDVLQTFTQNDYLVTTYPTRQAGDGYAFVKQHGSEYDLVVCSGGDGTLNEITSGIVQSQCKVPLGYIPAGSTNDFARSLSIPFDPVAAVTNIVSGAPFMIDVGSFNGEKNFVYIAAFGAFTDVSYSTDQQFKNIFGHAAYILNGARTLSNIASYHASITFDDITVEDDFIYAMITNSLSVGGMKSMVLDNDVSFDDGLFECLFIKTPKNAIELQAIINSLLLSEVHPDYMFCFKAKNLQVNSTEEIPWTLDGDFGGNHKSVTIKNIQKVLPIIR